ncbi:alpha/beta hydrolase [Mangrovimonas sp. ST2L15]|uniref:alpha/beta hydrolase n=1 Tax=Mangrovimonas sp. ST2L15 TaxID=1645916 RepID=UPI0006B4069C|nr:alpha/beta hydrolase-fold protein [Mangrovimonas sp. ST2L15]
MRFNSFLHFIFLSFCFLGNAQNTDNQQIDLLKIYSPELKVSKKIWVYIPESYQSTKNAYPVIYMPEGQNLFSTKKGNKEEWAIDKILDSLDHPQSIIIGIENTKKKRLAELTPFKNDSYGGGNGDAYIDFIKNTLKPKIDATYRTKPNAKHTTIWGSTVGGLFSFYAVIRNPETFGNAGVFSPSFWFSESIYEYVQEMDIPDTSRFYFLAGTNNKEDLIANQIRMVSLLERKGVHKNNIHNKVVEGGINDKTMWNHQFLEAYLWLMASQFD